MLNTKKEGKCLPEINVFQCEGVNYLVNATSVIIVYNNYSYIKEDN